MNLRFDSKKRYIVDNFINIIVLSVLTGLFAGVIITFYNIFAFLGEEYSVKLYELVFENPAFVPLLFLGLAAGALVIGTVVRFVPMIRGSGIPQIEGAARGIIRFKWYVTLCSMFAASLACMFLGLSAGAEGPSLEMGGCAGSAVGTILKRNHMARRLQIASGASAGLAVAFNAPITGLVFALEEAFRSFSPQVFISAAISVVVALFTRNAIRPAISMGGYSFETGFAFNGVFDFVEVTDPIIFLWIALGAVCTALAGVLFYHLVFLSKRLFKRITFLKGVGKYLIPFLIAGAFGLISVYAMGGGHSFIEAVGGGDVNLSVFGAGLLASLGIIVLMRFIAAVLVMGGGVPCGVFIPMLAIGAGIGALLSCLFNMWGMDGIYTDYMIIICMAAFFTCVVKAPITGLVMIFELTGSYVNLLPALMGVTIGYLVGVVCRIQPIYEKCLEMYIDEEKLYEKLKKERITLEIQHLSRADGERIRALIWPTNGLVTSVKMPDGQTLVPDGEFTLAAGEVITFECETDDLKETTDYLYAITGKPARQTENK